MSITQDYPSSEQATDSDAVVDRQPADEQSVDGDEVETAVDAILAEDEADTPAENRADPGE